MTSILGAPEESMMLYACFPEFLGRPVIGQFEADGRLELLELAGPDLDVEIVPLVGDLENLGPREPVDPEPVSVDRQAGRADA